MSIFTDKNYLIDLAQGKNIEEYVTKVLEDHRRRHQGILDAAQRLFIVEHLPDGVVPFYDREPDNINASMSISNNNKKQQIKKRMKALRNAPLATQKQQQQQPPGALTPSTVPNKSQKWFGAKNSNTSCSPPKGKELEECVLEDLEFIKPIIDIDIDIEKQLQRKAKSKKVVINGVDGCNCVACKKFVPYAEPDSTGIFKCFSCKMDDDLKNA